MMNARNYRRVYAFISKLCATFEQGAKEKRIDRSRPRIACSYEHMFIQPHEFLLCTLLSPSKSQTMPQDSNARLNAKRKATLKLNKRAEAAAAKGEKPKGKPVPKKKA